MPPGAADQMPKRQEKPRSPSAQLVHALGHHGIDLVVDVGANHGQYARTLRAHGWPGPILSIEPDPRTHALLVRNAAGDPAWTVLPPLAAGALDGTATLARSAESDMSSLLAQGALLRTLSPSSAVEDRLQVAVRRLDGLPELRDAPGRRLFVKLDLQGGEAAALDGATGLFGRVAGLQVEMALVELYRGERPWLATIAWLEARGFVLHLVVPGYYERKLGRQLQLDGIFFRPGATPSLR